jgi:hypothetical protein
MYQSFIPSFLPVMNSQQQLSAIYPDFGAIAERRICTLEHWQNTSFFDRLADISYFVSVKGSARNTSRFAYQSVWLGSCSVC